jgi:hypothetical protein
MSRVLILCTVFLFVAPIARADDGVARNVDHGSNRTSRASPESNTPAGRHRRLTLVGASDGRSYAGVQRSGVSVFDFKMPGGESNRSDPDLVAKFVGYGKLPGLRDLQPLETQTNFHEQAQWFDHHASA